MTPPPVAVVSPRMHTPKISIFLRRPIMAPEAAKATVPQIFTIKINVSMPSLYEKAGGCQLISKPISSMAWRMWMAMACWAPSGSRRSKNSIIRAWSRRVAWASSSRRAPEAMAVSTA